MAWRAYLEAIQENAVPNDSATIRVRFEDAEQQKIWLKEYKLVAGVTVEQMRVMVINDLNNLNIFESVKATIAAFVGNEIT